MNVNNSIKGKDKAINNLNQVQAKFNDTTKALQIANAKFINSQGESSQAAQNAKAALTSTINSQNVYNIVFNAYIKAKKLLSEAQEQKLQTDLTVQNGRNALNLAT